MTEPNNFEKATPQANLAWRLVRQHWYCFSYTGIHESSPVFASTYTGYAKKGITLSRINENKKYAGLNDGATLISCSYLGYMTREEFTE